MTVAAAGAAERELRALDRIAHHCALLDRAPAAGLPACERLEAELGAKFAVFLVGALREHPARHTGWLAA